MRKVYKSLMFIAATAMAFVSCNEEIAPVQPEDGKLVTVYLGVDNPAVTKANFEVSADDKTFTPSWTNGDQLAVSIYSEGADVLDDVTAVWNSSEKKFAFQIEESVWNTYRANAYDWNYSADYGTFDWSGERTQNGDAYASQYDVMRGEIEFDSELFGEKAGKPLVINMERKSAILYFHLTANTLGFTEPIKKATLTIGNDDVLTASAVEIKNGNLQPAESATTSNEIVLNVENGPAINATNGVKLWFNVLPVIATSLTLTVESENYTCTISNTNGDVYLADHLYKIAGNVDKKWVAKPLYNKITRASEIEDGTYVICAALNSDKSTLYYLENTNKTKPSFIAFDGEHISIADDNSTIDVVDATNATWTIEAVEGGYSITSTAGNYALATTSANDGLTTQSTYVGRPWTIEEDATYNWSIKYNATSRYLCLYSLSNPRTYDAKTTNANGVFFLYKLNDPRQKLSTPANLSVNAATKLISWDSVPNADSYELIIGNNAPINVNTNSFDASDLVDDYYTVKVTAVSSDSEHYKNSSVAVLEDAVFGTPTLATPSLTAGTVTETSITVNWSTDARATAGYHCEIWLSETRIAQKDVDAGTVTFNSLTDGQGYSVRVNAKAVTGAKAYAASNVQSIDVATTAAAHVSDITSEGTYTVFGLTVYAVANTSTAIVGDGTGYVLFYKSSHGLKVGDTFDTAGPVQDYHGIWEFNGASITNKSAGGAPSYGEATDADEAYITTYKNSPSIVYIHARGHQNGQDISVGSKTIHLSAANSATNGLDVEMYGMAYGYHASNDYMQIVATSITEDPTTPKLSIDKNSKTWQSDETGSFVVTVSAPNGGWTVTPSSLTWATVAEDHVNNTITVTPTGNNTSDADYESTLTVTHAVNGALTESISLTQKKAGSSSVTYSFTIQTSDFNTTSYVANNSSHEFTATCTTDPSKTMTVYCTSYQVMQSSSAMQWQKNAGYIYNTTDLGTIISVDVNSTAGTFTTNYGTTEHPTSGTTVGNGYFTVKVGNATGKTSSIVVTFTK